MNPKIKELREKIFKAQGEYIAMRKDLESLEMLEIENLEKVHEDYKKEVEKGVPNYTDDDAHRFDAQNQFAELEAHINNEFNYLRRELTERLEKLEKLPDMFSVMERLLAIEKKLEPVTACNKPEPTYYVDPSRFKTKEKELMQERMNVSSRPAWIRDDGTIDIVNVPIGTMIMLKENGKWVEAKLS